MQLDSPDPYRLHGAADHENLASHRRQSDPLLHQTAERKPPGTAQQGDQTANLCRNSIPERGVAVTSGERSVNGNQ
jgi:hypothetical protein